MPSISTLAESNTPCVVEASSPESVSKVWFRSKPIDRTFVYRAIQLQLQTDSSDHGHDDGLTAGQWSWFEVVIFETPDAIEPKEEHVWRSHWNRTDPDDTEGSVARHFGFVFDRRHELFDVLKIGHAIGVRVCAKYAGWKNLAKAGRLNAKLLDEDVFSPVSWTLSSDESNDMPLDIPDTIQDGVYTLTTTSGCSLVGASDQQTDEIWFTTPALQDFTISKLQDIQLFTVAHNPGKSEPGVTGVWSWFDIVVLETPESQIPRVKDGRSLVWRSHDVLPSFDEEAEQTGILFHSRHDIFAHLEPGNVIAVRPCVRFAGPRPEIKKPKVDWEAVTNATQRLQGALSKYLDELTPEGKPPAVSVETALLGQEIRSDWEYGAKQSHQPLRLLSFDGGGVRGISSLYILKDIMAKVTGDRNAKPCEYFDMMAGTSTGGLLAIMLGRLRMTIDECIATYNELAEEIFASSGFAKIDNASDTGARYSAKALEDAIKKIVKRKTGNPDALMRDPGGDCEVFVLTCRADDLSNSVATHMRTYTNGNVEKSFADYKIWEAARATSAAPTYFPRIKLGDHEYIDGGVGFNNPVLLLLGEARVYYGFARPISCLVTIGTGMNPNVVLPNTSSNALGNVGGTLLTLERMWELVTLSEHAHQMAQAISEPGTYYRFNVGKKLAEKRWIESVAPTVFQRWFGSGGKVEEKYTPENWAKVTIALDDYEGMEDFVKLTIEFMKAEVEKVSKAAGRLPPRRLPAPIAK